MKNFLMVLALLFFLAAACGSPAVSPAFTSTSPAAELALNADGTIADINPTASTGKDMAPDGKKIYETICLECHLRQCDAPGDIIPLGLPAQTIAEAIVWGKGGMPGFQNTFSADEINAIVTYVTSSSNEQPPAKIAAAGPVATLYWDKCSGCHGVDRQGGLGPALVPQTLSGEETADIKSTISNGRPGTAMPPWQGTLTGRQIDDLIDYILSPVQESDLTWGIDDMCGNCVKVTPTGELPERAEVPRWGAQQFTP